MQKYIILLLLAFVFGCASQGPITKYEKPAESQLSETDSTEYELIIIDPGFESWFITRAHTASAHTEEYYKHWNQWYVTEWNSLHDRGHPAFENRIDYDPFEDYGFEINHKLYYYFLFTEEKLGFRLVNRGPVIR
ncbi:MAG: DUF6146 family protein [Marinifilaceae bacterium]|jgi:hypothetical protein